MGFECICSEVTFAGTTSDDRKQAPHDLANPAKSGDDYRVVLFSHFVVFGFLRFFETIEQPLICQVKDRCE